MTCNIRTAHASDGPNAWPLRREACASVIRSRSADVICFQEMTREQHEDLSARLPGFAAVGTVDEPGKADPVNCDTGNRAIAVLRHGGFRDTYGAVHGAGDPGHTFHRFEGPAFASRVGKMDWVFVRGDAQVVGAEVVDDAVDGRYPSDHYFVAADLAADAAAAAAAQEPQP